MPKQIYMENQTFRDILHQFLEQDSEGKSEKSPSEMSFPEGKRPRLEESAPFFSWKAPEHKSTPRHGYAASPAQKKAPPPDAKVAAAPVTENVIALKDLKTHDHLHVRCLMQLGADELKEGVTLTLVKKAHRRLAKRLHPDAGGKRELFQLLQSAYEALCENLPSYISASTCDSESASAAGSPRRDAA